MESETNTSVLTENESKTLVGRLFVACGELEWKTGSFLELLETAGYEIPRRTVYNWADGVKRKGTAILENKNSGRQKALTDEELDLLVGWTLWKNKKNESVHLVDAKMFIFDNFAIMLSEMTICNYYKELGFKYKTVMKRSSSYQFDEDTLVEKGAVWLRKQKLDMPKQYLASVDCTYTSHRTRRSHGYGPTGGQKLNESCKLSKWTNCIVTMIWADGVNRTPSVLFTFNPQFNSAKNNTKVQKENKVRLEDELKLYKIDKKRIIYVQQPKGKSKSFVRESTDVLERAVKLYKIDPNSVVFHDSGNAFFKDGKDIFLDLGFKNVGEYDAPTHHKFSPNDNEFHGAAKQQWNTLIEDHSDDIKSSICLLYCLDKANEHVAHYFQRNLQFGVSGAIEPGVRELFGGRGYENFRFHQKCLAEYRMYIGESVPNVMQLLPDGLDCDLDGDKWIVH